jgi:DNA-binding transcriptional ArsR family regulator
VNNAATELDRSFHVLAHPVRRAIIERLSGGPATVGEATSGLGISKPAVTKHLKLLEQAGAVTRTVQGRTHRLTLVPQPLDDASAWLERHRGLWERKFAEIDRYLAEND